MSYQSELSRTTPVPRHTWKLLFCIAALATLVGVPMLGGNPKYVYPGAGMMLFFLPGLIFLLITKTGHGDWIDRPIYGERWIGYRQPRTPALCFFLANALIVAVAAALIVYTGWHFNFRRAGKLLGIGGMMLALSVYFIGQVLWWFHRPPRGFKVDQDRVTLVGLPGSLLWADVASASVERTLSANVLVLKPKGAPPAGWDVAMKNGAIRLRLPWVPYKAELAALEAAVPEQFRDGVRLGPRDSVKAV
jgi:hypothetical protein